MVSNLFHVGTLVILLETQSAHAWCAHDLRGGRLVCASWSLALSAYSSSSPGAMHPSIDQMLSELRADGAASVYAASSTPTSSLTWITWFCSLPGHEYFCEVSEDFIEDDFNLTGLNVLVPFWKEAMEMVLDVEPGITVPFPETARDADDFIRGCFENPRCFYRRILSRAVVRSCAPTLHSYSTWTTGDGKPTALQIYI